MEAHLSIRQIFTKEVTESDPYWNLTEPDSYLIMFGKTKFHTNVYECHHGRRHNTYQEIEAEFDVLGIDAELLNREPPVECARSIVQMDGLSLSEGDIQSIAANLAELRNNYRPGTKVVLAIDVKVHYIERLRWCALDLLIDFEETTEVYPEWEWIPEDRLGEYRLTLDEIERLVSGEGERHTAQAEEYDGSGDNTCSICLDIFSKGDVIARTSCSHSFHPHCFENWMNQQMTCPLCRAQIRYSLEC